MHPFWIKVPLFCPDDWLDWSRPFLSRFYSGLALAVWLLVCLWAVGVLYVDWQRFSAASAGVLAATNWWSLAAAWFVLKLGHEISHAAVCKKYGGTVREVGLIFILFAPVAYVDVTSCWRFASKWQRIHTAAAGMYGELFLAALAVIGWSCAESAVAQHLLYNVAFMASLTTLLFNANPLMRFDGYYLLADLADVPNLYSQGTLWVRSVATRLFFGAARPARLESGWRGAFVRGYGLAAMIWRVLVSVSLTLAATTLFQGWGIVLAAGAVALWFAKPLHHVANELHRRRQSQPFATLRFVGVSVALAGLLVACIQLPWPGARTAPESSTSRIWPSFGPAAPASWTRFIAPTEHVSRPDSPC